MDSIRISGFRHSAGCRNWRWGSSAIYLVLRRFPMVWIPLTWSGRGLIVRNFDEQFRRQRRGVVVILGGVRGRFWRCQVGMGLVLKRVLQGLLSHGGGLAFFLMGMIPLPNSLSHVTSVAFIQARLSPAGQLRPISPKIANFKRGS